MATNDFLVFGGGAGANVMSQSDWAALAARVAGFSSGVAEASQLNKAWRQSSIMAAVLAQFISDRTGQDALDNGTTATLLANLKASAAAVNGDSTKTFSVASATQGTHAVPLAQLQQGYAWFGGLQVITASGNFTVPANVYRLRYRIWGGGGGSGGVGSSANGGAGGGGEGGYSEGVMTVTPGQVIAATIGAAGVAGGSGGVGGPGGTTTFNGVSCGGGGGGAPNGTGSGGAGGTASGGAVNRGGRPGGAALLSGISLGGAGGGGSGGGYGAGAPGSAPGQGAGGPGSAGATSGAAGFRGEIVLEW